MDEGSLYVLARREAARWRFQEYVARLLWADGLHRPARSARPAPLPLIGERATMPERMLGIPAGTFAGSDYDR